MSEKLKLAEAYYAVAAHQKACAHRALEIATQLSECADRLCEENMRDSQAKSATEPK